MRPVRIPGRLLEGMRRHARETYPDECCGFLVAAQDPPAPDGPRSIVAAEPAPNDFDGERRRRFVIRPEELLSVEHSLEGTGRVVAGFYHSHPDHPALPSAFDQEHAWPWYTYLVLSVTATETPSIGAFELDAVTGVFRETELAVSLGDAEVRESLRASGLR
ncbi:MAG: M67 family metallopeptidase [Thermoplasmata archaeon]